MYSYVLRVVETLIYSKNLSTITSRYAVEMLTTGIHAAVKRLICRYFGKLGSLGKPYISEIKRLNSGCVHMNASIINRDEYGPQTFYNYTITFSNIAEKDLAGYQLKGKKQLNKPFVCTWFKYLCIGNAYVCIQLRKRCESLYYNNIWWVSFNGLSVNNFRGFEDINL